MNVLLTRHLIEAVQMLTDEIESLQDELRKARSANGELVRALHDAAVEAEQRAERDRATPTSGAVQP